MAASSPAKPHSLVSKDVIVDYDITYMVNGRYNARILIKEYTKNEIVANIKKNLSSNFTIRSEEEYKYKVDNLNRIGLVYFEGPRYMACYFYDGYKAFGSSI